MKAKETEALKIIKEYLLSLWRSPSIRELQVKMNYGSPRSASLLIEGLLSQWAIIRKEDWGYRISSEVNITSNQVVNVPLVGDVACWTPIFAEENIETTIPVSTKIVTSPQEFFFLRARGDSMDKKGINDGDLVLIHQQDTAKNGDTVLAIINDSATLKELQMNREDGIALLIPHSTNPGHKPIILDEDFLIQGVVIKSFWKI